MCVTSTDLLQGGGSELARIEHIKSGRELVPLDAGRSSVALRESLQAERRADQQRHHHRQIWTKDPHGGPYKKVINSGLKPSLCKSLLIFVIISMDLVKLRCI